MAAGNYILNVTTVADENHTSVSKTAKITVNKASTEIKLTNETLDLKANDTVSNFAQLTPDDVGTLNYSSSNDEIVEIKDGMIIAVKAGRANITVSFDGNENYTACEATIAVIVTPMDAKVRVNKTEYILYVGDEADIIANTIPEALSVDYETDDEFISVDNNGHIKALGEGNGTIFVSVGDNLIYTYDYVIVNVVVNRIPTEITLTNETLGLEVFDVVGGLANLTPADAGNLTYVSSNESVVKVYGGGWILVYAIGTANVTVSFAGDDKYAAAESKTITVTVSLKDASVSVENDTLNLNVDGIFDLNATTVPHFMNVQYESSNASVAYVTDYGIVVGVGEGTAIITLTVGDNVLYALNSTNVTVNVKKIDTTIDVDEKSLDLKVNDNSKISANLTPADAGNLTFTSSNSSVVTVDDKCNVVAVGAGNANIIVSYGGNYKYNAAENKTIAVAVNDNHVIVSAPDVTKYYNGSERFVVTVTDSDDNPLADQSVSISICGVTYSRTTDVNGTASIAICLVKGEYNVTTVACNNTVYSKITVLPTVNATDLVKVFRNATQFYATFKDSEGNYLAEGTTVRFNIHGVFYDREISGDKGLAKLNINLEQGEYIITAMNLKTGENATNNITVISRLIENKDLIKYYRNASQYTVKVMGDDGKAVGANETVTFNINGMLYNRTTNESGIAKLNINLHPGNYIITAEYKNCRVSNNIKVLPILSADDLTKKYGAPDQFIATLVDGQGKSFAGETVQFNVNGVFYNRITDSNGQAKLNIRLMPGKYIITSSYNAASISNTITVLS